VPDVEPDAFNRVAEQTKQSCPVSKALAGTEIKLKAELG
jgi:osmotically inducible protein OsmC